jgi:hypothetical protein
MQDMLEALVRHERSACPAALEERVRRDRRPVREAPEVLGTDGFGRGHDGLLLSRGSRHLRDPHRAFGYQYGVRERAADVDSDRAHRAILWQSAE